MVEGGILKDIYLVGILRRLYRDYLKFIIKVVNLFCYGIKMGFRRKRELLMNYKIIKILNIRWRFRNEL